MTKITSEMAKAALDLPMDENDAGAQTIRGYLKALLLQLWQQGEGFGGKRPFGNSGWDHDLYRALVKAGVIKGKLDEDGFIDEYDHDTGWALIEAAINDL